MAKIDFKKELKTFYKASAKEVEFVDVPEMNFLKIDGLGAPGAQVYQEAVEALFQLSYTIKFMIKKGELAIDYGVMPLQGHWWVDDMTKFDVDKKDEWKWTMMIMQPELVTASIVEEAREQLKQKKNPPALSKIKFEPFKEGKAAQIMHIGPFSEEGPTIEKLHQAIFDKGFELTGKHLEIYLTDIRRAAPENWKTIIRQPYS